MTRVADMFFRYKYDLLALCFFVAIIPVFMSNSLDGDMYWHLKSGEWIWQNQQLPDSDPFSFTTQETNPYRSDSHRIPFLLKGYWVSQLVFYCVSTLGGLEALFVLRALLLMATLLVIYLWMRKRHHGPLGFASIVLVGSILAYGLAIRPTLFSYLLATLVLFVLDTSTKTTAVDRVLPRWRLYALPFLMLLWANMHGGYLLGVGFILIFLCTDILHRVIGKKCMFSGIQLLVLGFSVLVTLFNPAGYYAWTSFFETKSYYAKSIHENMSPVQLSMAYGDHAYAYYALLALVLSLLVFKFKKIGVARSLVVLALIGLSFTAVRHVMFFGLTIPLLAPHFPNWSDRRFGIPVVVVVLGLWFANVSYASAFDFNRGLKFYPRGAAEFLNEANPQGNLFNYYDWGGFLMFYSPRFKVFTDGRGLIEEYKYFHDLAIKGKTWRSVMDKFRVNTIIVPGTRTFQQKVFPLVRELAYAADDWHLVFFDETAVVFVRDTLANKSVIQKHEIPKWRVAEHFALRYAWQLGRDNIPADSFYRVYGE